MKEQLDRKQATCFSGSGRWSDGGAQEVEPFQRLALLYCRRGTQDVIKVEWIFDAGILHQNRPLLASATNSMLTEETGTLNSGEIAEKIDYYGAFLQTDVDKDTASISLYCLVKHLDNTLPIAEEVIKEAVFPDAEFDTYLRNSRQSFLINKEKVGALGRKQFMNTLFGDAHPYGKMVTETHFDSLTREDLLNFYGKFYTHGFCSIVVAGKVDDAAIASLDRHFGQKDWAPDQKSPAPELIVDPKEATEILVPKTDGVQSAIPPGTTHV